MISSSVSQQSVVSGPALQSSPLSEPRSDSLMDEMRFVERVLAEPMWSRDYGLKFIIERSGQRDGRWIVQSECKRGYLDIGPFQGLTSDKNSQVQVKYIYYKEPISKAQYDVQMSVSLRYSVSEDLNTQTLNFELVESQQAVDARALGSGEDYPLCAKTTHYFPPKDKGQLVHWEKEYRCGFSDAENDDDLPCLEKRVFDYGIKQCDVFVSSLLHVLEPVSTPVSKLEAGLLQGECLQLEDGFTPKCEGKFEIDYWEKEIDSAWIDNIETIEFAEGEEDFSISERSRVTAVVKKLNTDFKVGLKEASLSFSRDGWTIQSRDGYGLITFDGPRNEPLSAELRHQKVTAGRQREEQYYYLEMTASPGQQMRLRRISTVKRELNTDPGFISKRFDHYDKDQRLDFVFEAVKAEKVPHEQPLICEQLRFYDYVSSSCEFVEVKTHTGWVEMTAAHESADVFPVDGSIHRHLSVQCLDGKEEPVDFCAKYGTLRSKTEQPLNYLTHTGSALVLAGLVSIYSISRAYLKRRAVSNARTDMIRQESQYPSNAQLQAQIKAERPQNRLDTLRLEKAQAHVEQKTQAGVEQEPEQDKVSPIPQPRYEVGIHFQKEGERLVLKRQERWLAYNQAGEKTEKMTTSPQHIFLQVPDSDVSPVSIYDVEIKSSSKLKKFQSELEQAFNTDRKVSNLVLLTKNEKTKFPIPEGYRYQFKIDSLNKPNARSILCARLIDATGPDQIKGERLLLEIVDRKTKSE